MHHVSENLAEIRSLHSKTYALNGWCHLSLLLSVVLILYDNSILLKMNKMNRRHHFIIEIELVLSLWRRMPFIRSKDDDTI